MLLSKIGVSLTLPTVTVAPVAASRITVPGLTPLVILEGSSPLKSIEVTPFPLACTSIKRKSNVPSTGAAIVPEL